jgi:hypothetical protein
LRRHQEVLAFLVFPTSVPRHRHRRG